VDAVTPPRSSATASALRELLLPGALLAAAALAAAASPAALEYRRDAAGELWRLLTCHWVHWSAEHLGWDLLTLMALAWGCRRHWRRALAALAAATVTIPVAVALLQPGLASYRGLSGLASTLFVMVACELLARRTRRLVSIAAALALAGFAGKVAWELTTGAALFVDGAAAGFVPVPLAHLVGGLCGAVAGAVAVDARASSPPGRLVDASEGERRCNV
jgi:rhomboid family GlyGly-CTERM serine protease